MWVDLNQSTEGLKIKDWGSSKVKEFCLQTAFILTWKFTSSLDFQTAGLPYKFQTCCISQFLKINLSFILSPYYKTHLICSVSLKNPDWHNTYICFWLERHSWNVFFLDAQNIALLDLKLTVASRSICNIHFLVYNNVLEPLISNFSTWCILPCEKLKDKGWFCSREVCTDFPLNTGDSVFKESKVGVSDIHLWSHNLQFSVTTIKPYKRHRRSSVKLCG